MRSPRLKDIAREAKVSVATVSLVLNGKKNFSTTVRDRVYDAARRLNYMKPGYAASASTNHFALLIPEDTRRAFEWNFIGQVLIHLEAVLARERSSLVMIPVHSKRATEDIVGKVIASNVKGLFFMQCGTPKLFQQLTKVDIPIVLVANSDFQDRFHTVCVDDFQGAYEATRHLLLLGHRKIAYGEYRRAASTRAMHDRFIGFKKALNEEDLPFHETYRLSADLLHLETFQTKLYAMFTREDAPSAIFAQDDYLAAQIVVDLQKIGRRVPDDVSIVAIGDWLDYLQPFVPQISTMRINTRLLGTVAGKMIIRNLERKPETVNVIKVNQHFVERGSCIPLKAA